MMLTPVIAARPRERGDQAGLNWVTADDDDRD